MTLTPKKPRAKPTPKKTLSPRKRALMGSIRATYAAGFPAVVYLIDNIAGLGLPPWACVFIGAGAYGVKRAVKPDGIL